MTTQGARQQRTMLVLQKLKFYWLFSSHINVAFSSFENLKFKNHSILFITLLNNIKSEILSTYLFYFSQWIIFSLGQNWRHIVMFCLRYTYPHMHEHTNTLHTYLGLSPCYPLRKFLQDISINATLVTCI